MQFNQYLKQAKKTNHFAHSLIVQTPTCVDHHQLALNYLKAQVCSQVPYCDECDLCKRIDHHQYLDFIYFANLDGSLSKQELMLLQDKFCLPANENSGIKLYVICNFELVTKQLLNTLLKFIEEPPKNTYALFFTINANLVLKTITSRSQIIKIEDQYQFDHPNQTLNAALPHVFKSVCEYNDFIIENKLEDIFALAENTINNHTLLNNITLINKLKDYSKPAFNVWFKFIIALTTNLHKIELMKIYDLNKLNINRKVLVFKILDVLGA